MKWEALPLADRAKLMAAAVRNGYTDIRSIKEAYANYLNQKLSAGNRYSEGGGMDEDSYHSSYNEWKEAIAKHHHLDIDNDNTYDYMGFYYSDPARAWAMLDEDSDSHFTDEFKTATHPTFSNLSTYSGKYDPINNPLVATGGTWTENPNTFTLPEDWYKGPSIPERINYLERAEDNGVTMFMPDGSLPVLYNNEPWGGVLPAVEVTNQNAYGGNLFAMGNKMSNAKPQYNVGGVQGFLNLLDKKGIKYIKSSSYRPNAKTKSGNASWHSKLDQWGNSQAVDLVFSNFEKARKAIYSDPELVTYLMNNKLGLLEETTSGVLAKTGGTGKHFHLGPDRWALQMRDNAIKQFGTTYHPMQDVTWADVQVRKKQFELTPEEERLYNSKPTLFYNANYADWNNPTTTKTFELAYAPYALNPELDSSTSNGWALYNSLLSAQSLNDPLSWITTMASLSPKTTPQLKEAANTMYQLFAPQGDDYMYHGLNFAAYGGEVNKFNDGGFSNLPEQRAYRKAMGLKAPYNNYEDAVDMNDSIALRIKKFIDKGVSNCTLTASQLYGKPIGRARTIVNSPQEHNFYEVDENHVVPGTMVISSYPYVSDYNPDLKYHTMIVTGFAPEDYDYTFRDGTLYHIKKGEPLVNYSRGKASSDNYVLNIPLSVYNANSEGKTFNRYYRPIDEAYPQVMLPELIVSN